MKFEVIIFIIFSATILHVALTNAVEEELKCETEGCYEVIKTFVKLLEEKINETDKILAEAERELNEVTYGNDENFHDKINEINLKLSRLIIDLNTGIDGGEQTLIELINSVFKPLEKAETTAAEIEIETANGIKVIKVSQDNFEEVQDLIRKVNEEMRKLENSTMEELPKAIQDAFDKSEKFQKDSKDIRDIYDAMKVILADYEGNLVNAKMLTMDAIEKFVEIDSKISETERIEKEIAQIFKIFEGVKLPFDDLAYLKKLTKDSAEEAKKVFDDAFELLNEVTIFNVDNLLDDLKTKINELENYSADGDQKSKKFADDSSKFLDELEAKLDAAEVLEKRAKDQQEEIRNKIQEMEELKSKSDDAIKSKDDTIESARIIKKTLDDFVIKVEESREAARKAFELIPEVLQKIKDAQSIIENLEEKLEKSAVIANEAKQKSFKVKDEMDEILQQRENLQDKTEKLSDEINSAFDKMKVVVNEENDFSDKMEKLRRSGRDVEDLIDLASSKATRTKASSENVHKTLDDAIAKIQNLIAEIEAAKMIDDEKLNEFEKKLNEAEDELEATQLNQKIKNLKQQREAQNELIRKYKVEITELEHELAVIRENVKSLEDRCYRRTQLEP